MKRLLTLLVLGFTFYQAHSQVLFSQDFDSGSLSPMIAIDVDGKTLDPNIPVAAGPTWTVLDGAGTDKRVVSTSWFTPVGMADDWLISDSIHITDANTFIIWDAWTPDINFRDGYEVRVSTTDRQIASFTNIVYSIGAELTTRQTRAASLEDFVGQTIYFAFRNNSFDKFLLYLDNIKVAVLKDADVVLTNVDIEKYQSVNYPLPIKITIENQGAQALTSVEFSYTFDGETYTDTITGLNILPFNKVDLTHSLNFNVVSGRYPIEVAVGNPNAVPDENPDNNNSSSIVYGLDVQLPKKIVVEEGTGTWCTWCPRGAVFMDRLAQQYGDIAIPIAVHNFDPMTVFEYDSAFSLTLSGYPSGHVDRTIRDTDPLNFLTSVQSIRNRRVPVAIDVTTEYDEETRIVTFSATGYLSLATQSNELRFSAVITEDSVTGTTSGYDQINAYAGGGQGSMGGYENLPNPVPAALMVYDFVARALIGGFNGIENSIPDNLEANEEFTAEFSYQVPVGFDVEHMKAVVFILDEETGEILNGDSESIQDAVSTERLIPLGKSVLYPNPASDVMTLSVNFQTESPVSMKIYDTYGRLIRNLDNLDLSGGSANEKIDVSDLQTGNYILELRHQNSVSAIPFTRI